MKIINFTILISALFYFPRIADARKIFINEAVLASTNNQNHRFEVALFITNPSDVAQTLSFTNSLFLRSYSFNGASMISRSRIFSLARNLGVDKDTGGAIGISSASAAGDSWDSNNTSITVAAGTTLQILFSADPTQPSFYPNLLGGIHSSVMNTGTYFAQILFYGAINITDVAGTLPGFLIGSGSILYPNQTGGLESAKAYDFQINNGKAF